MKVLRIIARLNVGGPARHVVWLTKNLAGEGFESVLVAGTVPTGEEDMAYFASEHGVEPIFIEHLSRELSPKDLISLVKVYREIKRYEPDVIHTHTAKAGTIGRIAAFAYKWLTPGALAGRPRDVRVVHTFHGHVFHSYYGAAKTKLFLTIERILARFATDRIIVISRQQLDEINTRFRVGRSEQFSVIPLGLDLAPFSRLSEVRTETRDELGIRSDEIAVGFTGRLTEIKNLGVLLAAARASPAIRFLIVGDGALRPELEASAPKNVQFLGHRPDVARVISAFDIIALTSKNEGTPLSLIEAMAAGIPFVSTAVGGVVDLAGEVIERTDSFDICRRGVLVRTDDERRFAEGVAAIAADRELRSRMGAEGAEFVRAEYSLERLTADVSSLYRELLDGLEPR
jgi:glycosyltransferase involved in cell wall biosynthesis